MFEILLKNKNLTLLALGVGAFYLYTKMLETQRLKLEIELLQQQLGPPADSTVSGHIVTNAGLRVI